MPVYLREDVEWIAAVDQIFNPMKAHPDDALKGKIEDQWDDAIRFFVLGDLRTCTFKGGRRTHLWVEMTCMIAYFLTPLPALCRLINFEDLSNADVFDLGPKFFHQFVSDTTCIFYPQSSRLTSLKDITNRPVAHALRTDRTTSLQIWPQRYRQEFNLCRDTDNLCQNASGFSLSSGPTPSAQRILSRFSSFQKDKPEFTSGSGSSVRDPVESSKQDISSPLQFHGLAGTTSPVLYASYCPGHREPRRFRPQYPTHPSSRFNLLPSNLKFFCPSWRDPSRKWFTPGSKREKGTGDDHIYYHRRPLTPNPQDRDPLSPSFTVFWPSRRMIPPIIPVPIFEETDVALAAFDREESVITAERKSTLKSFLKVLRRGKRSPAHNREVLMLQSG